MKILTMLAELTKDVDDLRSRMAGSELKYIECDDMDVIDEVLNPLVTELRNVNKRLKCINISNIEKFKDIIDVKAICRAHDEFMFKYYSCSNELLEIQMIHMNSFINKNINDLLDFSEGVIPDMVEQKIRSEDIKKNNDAEISIIKNRLLSDYKEDK